MQDVKQLGYVGQVVPSAKPRTAGQRKQRPGDASKDDSQSQQHKQKQDPDDKHVVDEYA